MRTEVILAGAASDAHVVGLRLAELHLRACGFDVISYGAATPLEEVVIATQAHPAAVAVVIGSVNGHALEDLRGLRELRQSAAIHCPVVLGGNLGCGSQRDHATERHRLKAAGVDIIVDTIEELPDVLSSLVQDEMRRGAS